jgi:hypothetical protein
MKTVDVRLVIDNWAIDGIAARLTKQKFVPADRNFHTSGDSLVDIINGAPEYYLPMLEDIIVEIAEQSRNQ